MIIDTYRTNEYNIPLCEFVEFACTGMNFNIAYYFMEGKEHMSVYMSLTTCVSLSREDAKRHSHQQRVGSHHRPQAVINIRHLLCKVHMLRKFEEMAFKKSKKLDVARRFQSACNGLFESMSTDTFAARLGG